MSRMIRITPFVALALAAALSVPALAQNATSTSTPDKMPAKTTASTHSAKPMTHASKAHTSMPKVDLNSASREDLMKLPGIGDATADKIIAARPFKAKSELLSKGLVTKSQYSKLSSHVIAHESGDKK